MIVPSIDLQGGNTVQLVGGEERALDGGDPRPWLERFSRVGEVAVIDLDAALGEGSNRALIEELCGRQDLRVGGGIRDYETAVRWLDAGAKRIILGTAAEPALLSRLPKDRLCIALDARDGEVVVEGWKTRTGRDLLARVAELRDYADSFLVTFVEREGRLGGTDLSLARSVVEAAGDARVTIAGGVTSADEVADLDGIGADAQVGMAIYTGRLGLAQAFAAPLVSDRPDGLWPTVVVDESGRALGLAYSDLESVEHAIEHGIGAYHSRQRGLWIKGATSGQKQELRRIDVDCDRDALRFVVRQAGSGFCHLGSAHCWGEEWGLAALERTLSARREAAPEGSYSARLFGDSGLLANKLQEEARELAEAKSSAEIRHEAADLLYFTLAKLAAAGVPLSAVEAELDARSRRQTRRPGNAKPDVIR